MPRPVISFLADVIILLRYIEVAGQLANSLMVIKMRNSAHSKDQRMYEITGQGMIVRSTRLNRQGADTGGVSMPLGLPRCSIQG